MSVSKAKLTTLVLGQTAHYARTFTAAEVSLFAGISGDDNPIHVNHEWAKQSPFGQPIVHGLLTASLISAVLGTRLPGPGCIYLHQQLTFTAPVYLGDTVTAQATILEIDHQRRRVRLQTTCHVGDRQVIEGEALLKLPKQD